MKPLWLQVFARTVCWLAMAAILSLRSWVAGAQDSVRYDISFPNYVHHEARVRAVFSGAAIGDPLHVRMSRSSPGRYALHEFAKNVYDVSATDDAGRPLEVSRPDPYTWLVAGHDGVVVFRYTLFADHGDGTYSQIDNTHAHLNMPATFAWSPALEEAPIQIRFEVPVDSWRIATQLFATDDPFEYEAPTLQYFMDSPTEISAFHERSWPVEGPDGQQIIRLIVHHSGEDSELGPLEDLTARIVQQATAVFGELPRFDGGMYTFLVDAVPQVTPDGMEHRNSTYVTGPITPGEGLLEHVETISHEFLHAWNVERIRPASLEPFDFTKANMSSELWFAEGFTSYYSALLLRRAGWITNDPFATAALTAPMEAVLNAPGRGRFSAAEMSMRAVFVDAATSIDPDNTANTFISYYTWGQAIALALDLTLRARRPGFGLDDFMRDAWDTYGRREVPYRSEDLEALLARLTGDEAFARDFFRRFITGHEVPDYSALLDTAGFEVRPARPDSPYLGARLKAIGAALTVAEAPLEGTPLYMAGVEGGDVVLEVGGREVSSGDQILEALLRVAPGEAVAIRYLQRGEARMGQIARVQDPAVRVVTYESVGRPITPEIAAFREAWLGAK